MVTAGASRDDNGTLAEEERAMLGRVGIKRFMVVSLTAMILLSLAGPLLAEEAAAPVAAAPAAAVSFTKEMADAIKDYKIAMDTIWVLVTAFLVFFMNLGFAMVESGLCRAKNAVNILSKNFIVFAISSDRKSTRLNSSHER